MHIEIECLVEIVCSEFAEMGLYQTVRMITVRAKYNVDPLSRTHLVPDYCVTASYPVKSREERESSVDAQPDDVVVLATEVNLLRTK